MDQNVLHNLSYGMYVVSSCKGYLMNGQIANTVFQITSEPATVGVSINKNNLTREYIESSNLFTCSILTDETPLLFIGKFGFKSGRTENKFKGVESEILKNGCPAVIDHSLGYFGARVVKRVDCETHILFIGEVTEAKIIKPGRPMTYEYYHMVKRGTTPASAPTFIKGEKR